MVTNRCGQRVKLLDHNPWGLDRFGSVQDPESHRFTAHQRDIGNPTRSWDDLDFMLTRFYTPYLGRFLSVDTGSVSLKERQAVVLADPVVQGLGLEGSPLSLVVEVSVAVDEHDLARAVERAEILEKALGSRVLAGMAGQEMFEPTRVLARRLGVWCLRDGRQLLEGTHQSG